jgi:hypothetical protein
VQFFENTFFGSIAGASSPSLDSVLAKPILGKAQRTATVAARSSIVIVSSNGMKTNGMKTGQKVSPPPR